MIVILMLIFAIAGSRTVNYIKHPARFWIMESKGLAWLLQAKLAFSCALLGRVGRGTTTRFLDTCGFGEECTPQLCRRPYATMDMRRELTLANTNTSDNTNSNVQWLLSSNQFSASYCVSPMAGSKVRSIFVPPEEPPFGGDDGEPETAAPSFIWGYLIDKHRHSLGETKKMVFVDDYLTFLFAPNLDHFYKELRHTFGANEKVDPRYGEHNRTLWRQENPFEFDLLDQTISLRRFKMSELPPGGLAMPNRLAQVSRFLAMNPESRLQVRPRVEQLGGFLGGRTPYSWGPITERTPLGMRQPNKFYQLMEKVSDTNVKYMGAEALNGIWRLGVEEEPIDEDIGDNPPKVREVQYDWDSAPPQLFYMWRWANTQKGLPRRIWATAKIRSALQAISLSENSAYASYTDLAHRAVKQVEPSQPILRLRDISFSPGHLPLREETWNWPAPFNPNRRVQAAQDSHAIYVAPLTSYTGFSPRATVEVGAKVEHVPASTQGLAHQSLPALPTRSPARRIPFSPVSSLWHFVEDAILPLPSLVQLAQTFGSILNPTPLLMGGNDFGGTPASVFSSWKGHSGGRLGTPGPSLSECSLGSPSAYANWVMHAQRSRQAAALSAEAETCVRFGGTVIHCRSSINAKILQYFNYLRGYQAKPPVFGPTQAIPMSTEIQAWRSLLTFDQAKDDGLYRYHQCIEVPGFISPSATFSGGAEIFVYPQCVAGDHRHSGFGQVPYATPFEGIQRQVFTHAGYGGKVPTEPTPEHPAASLQLPNSPKVGSGYPSLTCKSEFLDGDGLGFAVRSEPMAVFLDQFGSEFAQLRGFLGRFSPKGSGPTSPLSIVVQPPSGSNLGAPLPLVRSSTQTIFETLRAPELVADYELAFTLAALAVRQRFGPGGPILFNAVNAGVERTLVSVFEGTTVKGLPREVGFLRNVSRVRIPQFFEFVLGKPESSCQVEALYSALLTSTILPLPQVEFTSTLGTRTVFESWLRQIGTSAALPRLLALGAFYGERNLIDICTLAANRAEVSALLGGASSTLEQLIAVMRLGLSGQEFNHLTQVIREEALTQILNVVDQRVKGITEAELSRFFVNLSDGLLVSTHPHFEKIKAFCAEVGARATMSTLSDLNLPALTQLLVLQSSFRHFKPYLTDSFFTQAVAKIGRFSPEVLVLTKNYVSHTPELVVNLAHFTKTAGSWFGSDVYLSSSLGSGSMGEVTISSYLSQAAEALERTAAQRSLVGPHAMASRLFNNVHEKQLYRLFILDYFFMQLTALRVEDTTSRMNLATGLAELLQNPASAVIDALRPLCGRGFEFPMLKEAGISLMADGKVGISPLASNLDFTAVHRVQIGSELICLLGAETWDEQYSLSQQWAKTIVSPAGSVCGDSPTRLVSAGFNGGGSLVPLVSALADIRSEYRSDRGSASSAIQSAFALGAKVNDLLELGRPTLLDWYTYSVGWLVDDITARRQAREDLTRVMVSPGVDTNSATLGVRSNLTNLKLGRASHERLPLVVEATSGGTVGVRHSVPEMLVIDRASTFAEMLLEQKLTVGSTPSNSNSAWSQLRNYIVGHFTRRNFTNSLVFETIIPSLLPAKSRQFYSNLRFGGMPTLVLGVGCEARSKSITEFNAQFEPNSRLFGEVNVGSIYRVVEATPGLNPFSLGVPLSPTERQTSLRQALVSSSAVEAIRLLISNSCRNAIQSPIGRLDFFERAMLTAKEDVTARSVQSGLESLGCTKFQLGRLGYKLSHLSEPREVLAILGSTGGTSNPVSVQNVVDRLDSQFPTLGSALTPQSLMLPFILLQLPNSVKLAYGEPASAAALLAAWSNPTKTLGERCHSALVRLITHYGAELFKRRSSGLAYDEMLLGFQRLSLVSQNYVTKLSAAEVFELSTGVASPQMQELASQLLEFEVRLASESVATLELGECSELTCYDAHPYAFYVEALGDLRGTKCSDSESVQALYALGVQLRNYGENSQQQILKNSIYSVTGHPLSSAWLSTNARLASSTFTGFRREVLARLTLEQVRVSQLSSAQQLAEYKSWALTAAGDGYFQSWLLGALAIFSKTLVPQPDSSGITNIRLLGQFLLKYKPRLLTATEFTSRWEDVNARPTLVYELTAFALARMASRATKYQFQPGGDFQAPLVIGNIFRQALFTYEFGDEETRRATEQFWYSFVLGGGLPVLETDLNIATFMSSNPLQSRDPALVLDGLGGQYVLPAMGVLRNISVREQPGVVGYLLRSDANQSMSECVASAIVLASSLDSIDLSLCRLWVVPHFVRAVQLIDADSWANFVSGQADGSLPEYDPVARAALLVAQLRAKIDYLSGDVLMGEVMQSLGGIRRLVVASQSSSTVPYLPVWAHSGLIFQQVLAQTGGCAPETLLAGSLINGLSMQLDTAYVAERRAVLSRLSQAPVPLLSLLGLTADSCAELPNGALQSILRDLTCHSFSTDVSVELPAPLIVNGVSFSKLPTPYAIWGAGLPQLSVTSVVALAPFLLRSWLVGRGDSTQFFQSDFDAQRFIKIVSGGAGRLSGSFDSAVGWAKYGSTGHGLPFSPSMAFDQHISPQAKLHLLELYELASTEVISKLHFCNIPTSDLSRWVYQWVWEFIYTNYLSFETFQFPDNGISPEVQARFIKYIFNKCQALLLAPAGERYSAYAGANSALQQVDAIAGFYLNNDNLTDSRLQPDRVQFGTELSALMRALLPESFEGPWGEAAALKKGDARREARGIRISQNFQTLAQTVDRHCHKAAPINFEFAQKLNADLSPRAECYIPQNAKPKQPRAFGRDVFKYRDHVTSNPQATWVRTLRRMQEMAVEGTTETTTAWRFVAWLERRKWERQIEFNSMCSYLLDWVLQSPFSNLWLAFSEVQASPVTLTTVLIAYLNYWHTRLIIPMLYLKRRFWELLEAAHWDYYYHKSYLKRPEDKFDQVWNNSDWETLWDAVCDYTLIHDVLILGGFIWLPTVVYYFYISWTAKAALEEGLYQRNAFHVPLSYLERFDWAEVKQNRDTDRVITEHFPDFDYMRQDQFYVAHAQHEVRLVDYDNLWGSLEPKPQLDIFFGPRYVDEESFVETFEVVGYYSPDDSYMWPTEEGDLEETEFFDDAEGYIEIFHQPEQFPGDIARMTKWWRWDPEVGVFGNMPGLSEDDFAEIAFVNYQKTFFNQLGTTVRALIWLFWSTTWLWLTIVFVLLAEIGMRPEFSMWNYYTDHNTSYSPQFWFEYIALRAMVPARLKEERITRFHMLEYIEYTFPANYHRPDLHAPIFDAMERSKIRSLYALNFGVGFTNLTPEDTVRILRGTFVPPVYSSHWNLEGNAQFQELHSLKVQSRQLQKLRQPLASLLNRFSWEEVTKFIKTRRTERELSILKTFPDLETFGEPSFDLFKFFNRDDFMPHFYKKSNDLSDFMDDRKWFIHNMKNAAFVNTHTGKTKRRRRIMKRWTPPLWSFDKEWFGYEFSTYYHDAVRFSYDGPHTDAPRGAMFNPEYVEAAEVELGEQTFDPEVPVSEDDMERLEKSKRMAPVVLEINRATRNAHRFKESELRDIPKGHHLLQSEYPDLWDGSGFLRKYQLWNPVYAGAYDTVTAHGDTAEGLASYNRLMRRWRSIRNARDNFVPFQTREVIDKLGEMRLGKRGRMTKRKLTGPWAWAKLKFSTPEEKVLTDQATRGAIANEAPGIWLARHYQRRLKNRRAGWRHKHKQRMETYGVHVPRDDSAADNLTNFADISFNWESQPGGEETTKPHYHWFFENASTLFDHSTAKHTPDFPLHDRVKDLLWTLRYWETPIGVKFRPTNEVDILALNAKILKEQGVADLWAFSGEAKPTLESMYVRGEYLKSLKTHSEKSHTPPIRTWDAAIPIVNPFWWSWRAKLARLVLKAVPDTWYGRAVKTRMLDNLHLKALTYAHPEWRVTAGADETLWSDAALEPTPVHYFNTTDQILEESEGVVSGFKATPFRTLLAPTVANSDLVEPRLANFPLKLRVFFRNSEILNTQQRLFKLLQHSRTLTEEELGLENQVDSEQVSEFTLGAEQLSFWQTLKTMFTWASMEEAEYVKVQLRTLESIKGLEGSISTLTGARNLINTAVQAKQQLAHADLGLQPAVREELERIANARLQFAVENASRILGALVPEGEEGAFVFPSRQPKLALLNDENWATIQELTNVVPQSLTSMHNEVFKAVRVGIKRPDQLEVTKPFHPFWPYIQPIWYAAVTPFEVIAQSILYVSRVFFAFCAQICRALGLDGRTRDEWNYHQRQIGAQNRAAQARVAQIFISIRKFRFWARIRQYCFRAIAAFPAQPKWFPFRKLIRLTTRLRLKVKSQWTADRRRQLSYKQTMLQKVPAIAVPVRTVKWSAARIRVLGEANRLLAQLRVDTFSILTRRTRYSSNFIWLESLRSTKLSWVRVPGHVFNFFVFGLPTKIIALLNISRCIAQRLLSFTGFALFNIRQVFIKNSSNAAVVGLRWFQVTLRGVTQTLVYALYGVTSIFTTTVSLLKVILVGLEWLFQAIWIAGSGTLWAIRQALIMLGQLILWPAFWVKEKFKVFFTTYIKLIRMIKAKSRSLRWRWRWRSNKTKKLFSWKIAIRRINWWLARQARRVQALRAAAQFAVAYHVKPLSVTPARTYRWAVPYVQWFRRWVVGPVSGQFVGTRTRYSDPELIQFGSNFHKVFVGNKVKPNPPEWAKAPRRKKSGGMRPSRWRSYWVVRAHEHERQGEVKTSGRTDYGPFPLDFSNEPVEENPLEGWWPFG